MHFSMSLLLVLVILTFAVAAASHFDFSKAAANDPWQCPGLLEMGTKIGEIINVLLSLLCSIISPPQERANSGARLAASSLVTAQIFARITSLGVTFSLP